MQQFLAGFFAIMICSSCSNSSTEKKNSADSTVAGNMVSLTTEQLQNGHIRTDSLRWQPVSQSIRLNGMIDVPPQNLVSISAPMGGYVKQLKLLPGMHVRKGEVLAILEDVQFIQLQQDYLSAKAKMTYLRQEYERQRELNINKVSSDKMLQQVQSEYTTQQVTMKALAEKLALIGISAASLSEGNISRSIRIQAPINGFISAVKVNTGKYISPTEVICELIDPTDIHLNLNVFEKDINSLKVGQRVQAFTNEQPDELHGAAIILVTRNLDNQRAGEVHCHFDKYDTRLLPGMYMNAVVQTDNQQSLVAPDAALVRWQNAYYLFVARDAHTFEMVPVDKGAAANGYTAVSSKTETLEKNKIVVENAYTLLMKLKNTTEEE